MADRAKEIVEANGYSNGSIIDICIIVYLLFVYSLFIEGMIVKVANYNLL
jgi:hypothetical protein